MATPKLKLPAGAAYPVPNPLTGWGMTQANFDAMKQIGLIPTVVQAYADASKFAAMGSFPTAGTRKLWSDTTAPANGTASRTYWVIDRDAEGYPVHWPAPKSVTDPILSSLGRVASQPAVSLYRQYAAWMPEVPAQMQMVLSESEAFRVSFSAWGFSPDIPMQLAEFNYQSPWVPVFAEYFQDTDIAEVYLVHVQHFVAANPLDYNAPYQPATAATPKTAEQKAAAVGIIVQIVASRAPLTAKYDQIAEVMK